MDQWPGARHFLHVINRIFDLTMGWKFYYYSINCFPVVPFLPESIRNYSFFIFWLITFCSAWNIYTNIGSIFGAFRYESKMINPDPYLCISTLYVDLAAKSVKENIECRISYSVEIDVISKQSFVHLFGWNDESLNLTKVFFVIGLKTMLQHAHRTHTHAVMPMIKLSMPNHIREVLNSYTYSDPVLNCEIKLMQIVYLTAENVKVFPNPSELSSLRLGMIHWL